MPNWYWEKKELRTTPSQEKGLDFDTETRYRREGVRFLMELGKALNLSHTTMATAAVYYHRFYMFHAFQDFPRYVVSTCTLFLAGKAEETPKKCRDIIRVVRQLTNDRQFATFGNDPREEIMVLERVLLQTIKFDLQVDHPYESIIKFAKSLKGDQNKLQKMVQMSWTFVNDSLCTTLCLQWEPEIVAIAVMYLAVKLSKFEVKDWINRSSKQVHWWDQYAEDLEIPDLEEICHQVLDLYAQPVTAAKDAAVTPPPGAAPKPTPAPKPKPSRPAHPVREKPPQPQARPKSRPHTPPPPQPNQAPPQPPPPQSAPPAPPPAPGYVRPPMPGNYPPPPVAHPPAGYPMGYPPQAYPAVPPGAPPPGMPPYPPNQYAYPPLHQGPPGPPGPPPPHASSRSYHRSHSGY